MPAAKKLKVIVTRRLPEPVETRLKEVRSRMVAFAYDLKRIDAPGATEGTHLATAMTALVSIGPNGRPIAMPEHFREMLERAAPAAG